MIATLEAAPAGLGHRRHLALSSFWFGLFAVWAPLAFVLLPAHVDQLVPAGGQNGRIALMVGAGAIFSMLVPPLVGACATAFRPRSGAGGLCLWPGRWAPSQPCW